MADQVGEGIDRDGERAGADREVGAANADHVEQQRHREDRAPTADERQRLRLWLKDFRLDVTGHRPIAAAIVTAGGVDLREVDPRTLESRLVSGLYFAGEVLDLNADTGGYNLQAAFSTGWLAGRSAARLVLSRSTAAKNSSLSVRRVGGASLTGSR